MIDSGKAKKVLLATVITVLTLAIAGVAIGFFTRDRGPCPISITVQNASQNEVVYSESDWNRTNGSLMRAVACRVRYPTNTVSLLARVVSIETKSGSNWSRLPPQPEPGSPFSLLRSVFDDHKIEVPADTERLRLTMQYWRPTTVLPLGLGDFRARAHPPSKAAGAIQNFMKRLSRPLYNILWPGVPAEKGWKTVTFDLALPQYAPAAGRVFSGDRMDRRTPVFGAPLDQ